MNSRIWISCAIFIFSTGCNNNAPVVYPVSGKIVFADGSAARFGEVECRSFTDPPVTARGKIQKDGMFTLKTPGKKSGLLAGRHQITINQVVASPRTDPNVIHRHGHEVADKYRTYSSSDLFIEVAPDGEKHFELTVESR